MINLAKDIFSYLWMEGKTLINAPVLSALLLLIGVLLAYIATKWRYVGIIDQQKESMTIQENNIKLLKDEISIKNKKIDELEDLSKKTTNPILPHGKNGLPKETVVDIKKKLEKDRQHILLTVSKYPKLEAVEIAKQLSIDADVATFHLEELKRTKFVKTAHIMGSVWDNIPSRTEWSIDHLGRKYLVHHELIK